MRYRFALALLLLSTPVFAANPPKLRLPGDARPLYYDVDLTLIPGSKTF